MHKASVPAVADGKWGGGETHAVWWVIPLEVLVVLEAFGAWTAAVAYTVNLVVVELKVRRILRTVTLFEMDQSNDAFTPALCGHALMKVWWVHHKGKTPVCKATTWFSAFGTD